ncbi:MAG: metal-sulfur cluster assembly factor [Patescibacteria group bacterium]
MIKKDDKKIIPVPPEKRTQNYWGLLNEIIDPEVGIGIVDLGLIYDVEITNGRAVITMTLTSMGCPVGPSIITQVEYVTKRIPGIKDAAINLIWEPAWKPDRINPDIRSMLDI